MDYEKLGRRLVFTGVYIIMFTPAMVIVIFWLIPLIFPRLAPTIIQWRMLPRGIVTALYTGLALAVGAVVAALGGIITYFHYRKPRR